MWRISHFSITDCMCYSLPYITDYIQFHAAQLTDSYEQCRWFKMQFQQLLYSYPGSPRYYLRPWDNVRPVLATTKKNPLVFLSWNCLSKPYWVSDIMKSNGDVQSLMSNWHENTTANSYKAGEWYMNQRYCLMIRLSAGRTAFTFSLKQLKSTDNSKFAKLSV